MLFRISINNKVLQVVDVIHRDTTVFACNVTNKHDYAWTNFYLNVLGNNYISNILFLIFKYKIKINFIAEPPEIQDPLENETKVVEGESVEINCVTFGAPRPQVFW